MSSLVRITCRHAHGLLSEAMDRKLSPFQQMRLKLHLSICDACARVDRQFTHLRTAVRKLGQ